VSTADSGHVIRGVLGLTRLICCGLVIVSFALFAIDQAGGASRHQVAELSAGTMARPAAPSVNDAGAGQPRRFIDGAAKALTAPFRAIFNSGSQWAQRGFATLLALLVYGVGLGYLARYSQGRA
jgi:hypothetical protein